MYLIVNWEDPGMFEVVAEDKVDQETLEAVDSGDCDLISFSPSSKEFRKAIVSDEPVDQEDEDGDRTFVIDSWQVVR